MLVLGHCALVKPLLYLYKPLSIFLVSNGSINGGEDILAAVQGPTDLIVLLRPLVLVGVAQQRLQQQRILRHKNKQLVRQILAVFHMLQELSLHK